MLVTKVGKLVVKRPGVQLLRYTTGSTWYKYQHLATEYLPTCVTRAMDCTVHDKYKNKYKVVQVPGTRVAVTTPIILPFGVLLAFHFPHVHSIKTLNRFFVQLLTQQQQQQYKSTNRKYTLKKAKLQALGS